MTDTKEWLDANARYISAALVWLRLLLEQHIVEGQPAPSATGKGRSRLQVAHEELLQIEDEMATPPPLTLLSERLGLSPFEQNILLLCAAAEFDPSITRLLARVAENGGCESPTFALALSVFDDPAWDALSPQRPLRF